MTISASVGGADSHISALPLTESVIPGPIGVHAEGMVPVIRGLDDKSTVERLRREDQLEGRGPVKLQPLKRVVWV